MIRTWTKWMEKKISNSSFFIALYELYYKNIVHREIELAQVKDKDYILCVGGGAVPCTAVQMAIETGAKVHVIDIDPIAVNNARNLINTRGLSDNIQVFNCNGEEIDIEDYSVIHIALQVTPKEKVVAGMWNKAKKGTKLIVRMPKKNLDCFYCNLSPCFLQKNNICCEVSSMKNVLNTMDKSILMIKY